MKVERFNSAVPSNFERSEDSSTRYISRRMRNNEYSSDGIGEGSKNQFEQRSVDALSTRDSSTEQNHVLEVAQRFRGSESTGSAESGNTFNEISRSMRYFDDAKNSKISNATYDRTREKEQPKDNEPDNYMFQRNETFGKDGNSKSKDSMVPSSSESKPESAYERKLREIANQRSDDIPKIRSINPNVVSNKPIPNLERDGDSQSENIQVSSPTRTTGSSLISGSTFENNIRKTIQKHHLNSSRESSINAEAEKSYNTTLDLRSIDENEDYSSNLDHESLNKTASDFISDSELGRKHMKWDSNLNRFVHSNFESESDSIDAVHTYVVPSIAEKLDANDEKVQRKTNFYRDVRHMNAIKRPKDNKLTPIPDTIQLDSQESDSESVSSFQKKSMEVIENNRLQKKEIMSNFSDSHTKKPDVESKFRANHYVEKPENLSSASSFQIKSMQAIGNIKSRKFEILSDFSDSRIANATNADLKKNFHVDERENVFSAFQKKISSKFEIPSDLNDSHIENANIHPEFHEDSYVEESEQFSQVSPFQKKTEQAIKSKKSNKLEISSDSNDSQNEKLDFGRKVQDDHHAEEPEYSLSSSRNFTGDVPNNEKRDICHPERVKIEKTIGTNKIDKLVYSSDLIHSESEMSDFSREVQKKIGDNKTGNDSFFVQNYRYNKLPKKDENYSHPNKNMPTSLYESNSQQSGSADAELYNDIGMKNHEQSNVSDSFFKSNDYRDYQQKNCASYITIENCESAQKNSDFEDNRGSKNEGEKLEITSYSSDGNSENYDESHQNLIQNSNEKFHAELLLKKSDVRGKFGDSPRYFDITENSKSNRNKMFSVTDSNIDMDQSRFMENQNQQINAISEKYINIISTEGTDDFQNDNFDYEVINVNDEFENRIAHTVSGSSKSDAVFEQVNRLSWKVQNSNERSNKNSSAVSSTFPESEKIGNFSNVNIDIDSRNQKKSPTIENFQFDRKVPISTSHSLHSSTGKNDLKMTKNGIYDRNKSVGKERKQIVSELILEGDENEKRKAASLHRYLNKNNIVASKTFEADVGEIPANFSNFPPDTEISAMSVDSAENVIFKNESNADEKNANASPSSLSSSSKSYYRNENDRNVHDKTSVASLDFDQKSADVGVIQQRIRSEKTSKLPNFTNSSQTQVARNHLNSFLVKLSEKSDSEVDGGISKKANELNNDKYNYESNSTKDSDYMKNDLDNEGRRFYGYTNESAMSSESAEINQKYQHNFRKDDKYVKNISNIDESSSMDVIKQGIQIEKKSYQHSVLADNIQVETDQEQLNCTLEHLGVGRINFNDSNSIVSTFQKVLNQWNRKDRLIESLVQSRDKERDSHGNIQHLETKLEESQRALALSDMRTQELMENLESAKKELATEIKASNLAKLKLQQQVRASEVRAMAKEKEAEKLAEKLAMQAEKEKSQKKLNKETISKARMLLTPDKIGPNTPSSRFSINSNSELIKAYEKSKEKDILEMEALKQKVRSLADELRNLQNNQDFDSNSECNAVNNSEDLLNALEKSKSEQRASKEIQSRLQKKLDRVLADFETLKIAKEEVATKLYNLELEMKSRPSLKTWRECQNRITELEQALVTSKTEAEEAYNIRRLRKYTDTRTLIRRDRLNSKLGLNSLLESVPLETAREVLRDASRRLSVTDINEIGPSIEKLINVVVRVPRIQEFTEQICTAIFGSEDCGELKVEEVVPVIEDLVQFRTTVAAELSDRPAYESPPLGLNWRIPETDRALVSSIKQLVTLERRIAEAKLAKENRKHCNK